MIHKVVTETERQHTLKLEMISELASDISRMHEWISNTNPWETMVFRAFEETEKW